MVRKASPLCILGSGENSGRFVRRASLLRSPPSKTEDGTNDDCQKASRFAVGGTQVNRDGYLLGIQASLKSTVWAFPLLKNLSFSSSSFVHVFSA